MSCLMGGTGAFLYQRTGAREGEIPRIQRLFYGGSPRGLARGRAVSRFPPPGSVFARAAEASGAPAAFFKLTHQIEIHLEHGNDDQLGEPVHGV